MPSLAHTLTNQQPLCLSTLALFAHRGPHVRIDKDDPESPHILSEWTRNKFAYTDYGTLREPLRVLPPNRIHCVPARTYVQYGRFKFIVRT